MESDVRPIAGVDYPRTFQEFDKKFGSESECERYLAQLRWPHGFRCPHCDTPGKAWLTSRGLMQCSTCGFQASVTAGTVFEGTRKPLRTWFLAMWFVTSQKQGVSALGLQRVLGLGSYQTAWAWLHKLRRAMVCPGRELLCDVVEVDETYVGGAAEGIRGRGAKNKAIVAVAAEAKGNTIGRIRLQRIPDASSDQLHGFIQSEIEPGSAVHTDGWKGYKGLSEIGYGHEVVVIRGSGKKAHELLPRVHRVASLLDRWLLGTHQGGVQLEHLDYYLDEFTFRFNRRTSRSRGMLFYRLAQQAANTDAVAYKAIVGGKSAKHNQ